MRFRQLARSESVNAAPVGLALSSQRPSSPHDRSPRRSSILPVSNSPVPARKTTRSPLAPWCYVVEVIEVKICSPAQTPPDQAHPRVTFESQLPPTIGAVVFLTIFSHDPHSRLNTFQFVHNKFYTVCLLGTLSSLLVSSFAVLCRLDADIDADSRRLKLQSHFASGHVRR